MYKDKEKQKEANKERQRRYRRDKKGVTKGVTSEGVTSKALPSECVEYASKDLQEFPQGQGIAGPIELPANFGQPDCECRHCRNNRASGLSKLINHGPYKPASELFSGELNRVALPGDVDYVEAVA